MQIEVDQKGHCADFIRLNEEWITKYFALEEGDHNLAKYPFKIIDDGGHILSLVDDGKVAGVCALFRDKDNRRQLQLARMAVDPEARGKGYGNALMEAALRLAAEMGATDVRLYTNTVLGPAVALYHKYGFQTVSEGPHPLYARCNIVMEKRLEPA
jgi:ribosomal protein S18 acetylase RimI-like enzyme